MSAATVPSGAFVLSRPADPVVVVTAVGEAEGARGAAAALACAGAATETAPLLIDVGGRPPRQTLLATAAAQRLEERLVAHLPTARLAARGQFCQLAVPDDPDGLVVVRAAATVTRGAPVIIHVTESSFRELLSDAAGPRPTAVLLRADVRRHRALLAMVARDLQEMDLTVGVLKFRLGWVTERRALFGALPPDRTGLSAPALRLLKTKDCYGEQGEEADEDGTTEARQNGAEAAGSGWAA